MHKERRHMILSFSVRVAGILALMSLGFAGGYLFAVQVPGQGSGLEGGEPAGVDLSPVWKAWSVIDAKFVPAAVATSSPVATSSAALNQQKVYGMIAGLAASLDDPYTFFLPPVENQQFASNMSGSFEGVGMEVEVKDQILTVVSPLKDTPAAAAGIKSGDQILKIDGVSTEGMDTAVAVNKIRGPKGTQVALTIHREGWNTPRDIKVTREVINVPIVIATARPDGIFDIQLS